MRQAAVAALVLMLHVSPALTDGVEVQYGEVRPEHRAHVSKESCALAQNLRTKETSTVVSEFKTWSATVQETDPKVVPYEQARACIILQNRDGTVRSIAIGGFRTLRLRWVNERLLYVHTDVGHVASVGQLLDVEDMKWLYARTEYYGP